jgi:hypothetical protein
MSSTKPENSPSKSTAPAPKPLPEGYLWRLCIVLVLLLGGCVCLIFYNAVIGSLMSLAGLAFGKISGLNEMVASDRKDTNP